MVEINEAERKKNNKELIEMRTTSETPGTMSHAPNIQIIGQVGCSWFFFSGKRHSCVTDSLSLPTVQHVLDYKGNSEPALANKSRV